MSPSRALAASLACAALLPPASSLAASGSPRTARAAASAKEILRSHLLWATINVCNPGDQPDWVGVRGSMPGDGARGDRMFMRFRLQSLNRKTGMWSSLPGTAAALYTAVGTGRAAREEGESFQLKPVAGQPALELRGVVDFQWRRGRTVLLSAHRVTTAGHLSHAGADPAGYSAATCQIG